MLNEIWCFRNGWNLMCLAQHAEKHTHLWADTRPCMRMHIDCFLGMIPEPRRTCQVCLQASSVCVLCVGEAQVRSSQLLLALCLLFVFFRVRQVENTGPSQSNPVNDCPCWTRPREIPLTGLSVFTYHRSLQVGAHLCIHSHMSKQRYQFIFLFPPIFILLSRLPFFKEIRQRSDPHGSWHLLQSFLLTQRRPREREGTVWLQPLIVSLSWAPTLHPPGPATH